MGHDPNFRTFTEEQLSRTVQSFADAEPDQGVRDALMALLDAPTETRLRFALSETWVLLAPGARQAGGKISPSRSRSTQVAGTVYSTLCTYTILRLADGTRQDWTCSEQEEDRQITIKYVRSLTD